ncbi:hypothetical protein ACJX0J_008067, partial [Zea mays]
ALSYLYYLAVSLFSVPFGMVRGCIFDYFLYHLPKFLAVTQIMTGYGAQAHNQHPGWQVKRQEKKNKKIALYIVVPIRPSTSSYTNGVKYCFLLQRGAVTAAARTHIFERHIAVISPACFMEEGRCFYIVENRHNNWGFDLPFPYAVSCWLAERASSVR